MPETLHATAIAVGGAGVLLLGPPGIGKSDLALRLIDRGAILIADDRVLAPVVDGRLLLSPPATIAGLLEVRGVGLVRLPFCRTAAALLAIDLAGSSAEEPPRLPEPQTRLIAGLSLPCLALRPFDASTPLKVELAVAAALRAV